MSGKEKKSVETEVFLSSVRAGYHASGIYDGTGIKILKGSIVSKNAVNEEHRALKQGGLLDAEGKLRTGVYFDTPSAAAAFVCGRSANGWAEWKLKSGEKLGELRYGNNVKSAAVMQTCEAEPNQKNTKLSKQELRARKRFLLRLEREFEKKYFIGDIVVSDQEYQILLDESKTVLGSMLSSGRAVKDSIPLAVALVQIGIRKYDGRYFWPYVEKELGVDKHYKNQFLLGDAFVNTLRSHEKHITDASERVQCILFHSFVSNYYSKGLFELLFQYYSRDLERDIYRNTSEQMQALMDTLSKKASLDEAQSEAFTDQFMVKGARAYKLRSHTLQAISARPVHSRVRLRRLLRLIDRAFWKNEVPKNPSSRLTILFKEWINDSPAYKNEYRLYQLGDIRNRGKKHFSSPYLFAHIKEGQFELKLPAQIVAEEYADCLSWEITTTMHKTVIAADTYPVLTGFKTEEAEISLRVQELFGDIHCQLVSNGMTVRKFPILPANSVRFFDMEGDYASRLFKIPMCAYSSPDSVLRSSALISTEKYRDMTRWDFEFQQGDLVVLPDGSGMIVGDYYNEGFVPRGQVYEAEYTDQNGQVLPVYSTEPELILTVPKDKLAGTALYCDGIRHRLGECGFAEFENKDARGMQAVLLPLGQFNANGKNGIKTVVLDIPGANYNKAYSYVLIRGLDIDFPGSPYVFEERGAVLFPEHIDVSGDYEKIYGENGYQFVLSGQQTNLDVVINHEISLKIKIPVISWSVDKEHWHVLPAGEMWHTEFFEMKKLFFRGPVKKISLYTDSEADEDDESELRQLNAEQGADDVFTFDMTRFRSWLTRDIIKNNIVLKAAGEEHNFATVYTRSIVASYDVSADYEEGVLTWVCDTIGKADYYLDVVHQGSGQILANKELLHDGRLTIHDRLKSGIYKFDLYEAEEDDSGFDEPVYNELLSFQQQLTNRNDLSGQFLIVRSFKPSQGSNIYTSFNRKYYVSNFEKIDKSLYKGQLMSNGEDTGLTVEVSFLNKDDLRYFHVVAWHPEEEINVDLLYDRNRGTLELDQLPGLRSSESYRRYRELTFGSYVYFGFLTENEPEFITRADDITKTKEAAPYQGKRAVSVEEMGLSVRTYNALRRAGIKYAGDIQRYTAEDMRRIRNMGRTSIEEVISVMNRLGLEISQPEDETPQTNSEPASSAKEEKTDYVSETHSAGIPLTELGLSIKAYLALSKYSVESSEDLKELTPFQWSKILKELGSLTEIDLKMAELGLKKKH